MAKIKLKAYPQSNSEWETLWQKFPALAAPRVTKEAEQDGVYKHSDLGTGRSWRRNSLEDSPYFVWYVLNEGARLG